MSKSNVYTDSVVNISAECYIAKHFLLSTPSALDSESLSPEGIMKNNYEPHNLDTKKVTCTLQGKKNAYLVSRKFME
jgi:hypothetical protein